MQSKGEILAPGEVRGNLLNRFRGMCVRCEEERFACALCVKNVTVPGTNKEMCLFVCKHIQ